MTKERILEALRWAAMVRQKELAGGKDTVPIDTLDADEIWTALTIMSGRVERDAPVIE